MKKYISLTLWLLWMFNVYGQQPFTLSNYFDLNPKVGASIDFKQPGDMAKVENYVKSLIESGNLDFPDIYGSNLTPNPTEWASYPDSVLWNVYYAYAAYSIYVDFSNKVPWKLSDLTLEQLNDFFYTEYLFNSYWKYFGPSSTPTNPIFTYSFLIEKNLIGKTRKETIERLFQWSRYHLQHFVGSSASPENFYDHWQYNDGPPVERVITGTTLLSSGEFSHWSRGCSGATTFFANVLRVINIPVKPKGFLHGTHVAMDFPSEKLIMTHGDDPYGIMDKANDVEIHSKEIFVSYEEIDSIINAGFEGNEIVSYGSAKVIAKHFPLWYFHSTDTNITYSNFSNAILHYTRSDTSEQYYQIMDQARARYSAVDVDRFNEIIDLYFSDTLWYKKVYGLKTAASIDTVLIPYRMGATVISDDTITFFLDDTTNYINPIFIHAENSRLSIPHGTIINLSEQDSIVVMAEDSINYYTYFFKKQVIPQHNISVDVYPETTGTAYGTGAYDYGSIAYVKAAPAVGFQFDNWTENDNVVSLDTIYNFTVTHDRTLIANFKIQTFTISAESNIPEGGSINGAGVYNMGTTAELKAIPASGYTFINWTEDGFVVSSDEIFSFTVDGNRNLIANFGLTCYITANANPAEGGTVTGNGEYGNGVIAYLNAIPSTGYNFEKWTEEGNTGWEWWWTNYSFTVDGNRSFIAHFEKQSFSIYAEPNNSFWGSISGNGWYDYGVSAELIAIPANGYKFVNWTEDGVEVSTNSTYTFIVENTRNNLIANFEQQTYTVSASTNPENAGTINGTGTYNSGSIAELSAVPSIGYIFVNWTENGTEVSANTVLSFTVDCDRNLVANFSLQSFTITVNTNPEIGGTVTGAGIYDYGFTAELKATPANGYNFINWTENGTEVSANTVYSFPVQSSKIFTANFEIINSIVINANSNAIQIFPNPTTGLVNVKLSDKTNDLHSKIRVFLTNSLGVKTNLSCIYKSDNLIEIDISEFANGMYIVEFYFDYRIIGSSKVLKK